MDHPLLAKCSGPENTCGVWYSLETLLSNVIETKLCDTVYCKNCVPVIETKDTCTKHWSIKT